MGLDDTSTVSHWFSVYKTMIFAQVIVKVMIYVCLFLDVVVKLGTYVLSKIKSPKQST